MTRPAVYTVPLGVPMVDALAARLWDEAGGDPLSLAQAVVLLPTRRACRSLREAFLRLSGGRPMLLPRMMPLGEIDEDELVLADDLDLPPAVPPLTRQLLLAKLVQAMGGRRPSVEQAAQLAAELGRFLDQVQTEGKSLDGLEALSPEEYAEHWQVTLQFLSILGTAWPGLLKSLGMMDAAERRNLLLHAQTEAWRKRPPAHKVIAAGSTGSVPATAELLCLVASLPQGRLVLPGLDQGLDAAAWEALEPTHPQFGLKALLEKLGVAPADVRPWCPPREDRRSWLLTEALRPAATTDAWRRLHGEDPRPALARIARVDCPGPREEAGVIALMLRGALEEEGRTAALVTPDRDLARRVAAELLRWGIVIDDSGGRPLGLTPPGAFLRLLARMVAEDFAPHALLAALKHPLAAGNIPPGVFRAHVRRLEKAVLRGPRPAPGIAGLRRALKQKDATLEAWLGRLETAAEAFAHLASGKAVPLAHLVEAHIGFAEWLAGDGERPGSARLWRDEAGEAAAGFVSDLLEAADAVPAMPGADYAGLFETLMNGRVVRPSWGRHPRLHIWGPLEARLQHADLVVLGGLNEGTWPPQADVDPWMSRPMRAQFGLPLPERRIGLSAHDFAQALCAPRVAITRAVRVDGTPTVPSRWLLRIEAVLQACGMPEAEVAAWRDGRWLSWFAGLDRAARHLKPAAPAPCPPVEARPRRLPVTAIETWMRDPYAVYARRILGLKALEPIDADPGAADYGTIIHDVLEKFLRDRPAGPLPPDAEARLLEIGRAAFEQAATPPGVAAFWWPRFERIAAWFAAHEATRRDRLVRTHVEVEGELAVPGPAGAFTLTAKADRVDLTADGIVIVDYKTGTPPSAKEVAAGFAPQLPLEAAIAQVGGFPGIPAGKVADLLYWRLKGGNDGGIESRAGDDAEDLAMQALDGLKQLVTTFDDPATPYRARPHPDKAPKYSDYLHLARVKEWASAGGEGDEG